MGQAENDATREIIAYMVPHGWQFVRHHPINPLERVKVTVQPAVLLGKVPALEKGFPDWILIHPAGGCFFLELKAPGKKPRPDQRAWINGFPGLVTWADGVPRLRQWLTAQNLPGGGP